MTDKEIGEHNKEVYAHAGLALNGAQLLEQALQNFLILHARAMGSRVTIKELDALEERLEAQTLGRLLKDTRDFVEFDKGVEETLASALKRRNFLAHRFFKERAVEVLHKSGRDRMIGELAEMQELFHQADLIASTGCKGLQKMLGISDEMIDQLFKELRPPEDS